MTNLKTLIIDLEQEYKELDKRKDKLIYFIRKEQTDGSSEQEQDLLEKQLSYMVRYSEILEKRIKFYKSIEKRFLKEQK